MSTVGWVITKTYIGGVRKGFGQSEDDADKTLESFEAIIGRTVYLDTGLKPEQVDDPVQFRLLDDDGEPYYEGVMRRDWLNGGEDRAFAPLTWAETDAGCTELQYRDTNNEWKTL